MLVLGTGGALLILFNQVQDANSFAGLQRLVQEEQAPTALQSVNEQEVPQSSDSVIFVGHQSPTGTAAARHELPVEGFGPVEESVPAVTSVPGSEERQQANCPKEDDSGLFCVYTVKPGDTLSGIAAALGLPGTSTFSAAQLISMSNDFGEPESVHIQPGEELLVPLVPGVLHRVDTSEVLSALAVGYGVVVAEIMDTNGIANADTLLEGSVLLIPSPLSFPASNVATELQMAEDEPGVSEIEVITSALIVEEDETDSQRSSISTSHSTTRALSHSSSRSQSSHTEERRQSDPRSTDDSAAAGLEDEERKDSEAVSEDDDENAEFALEELTPKPRLESESTKLLTGAATATNTQSEEGQVANVALVPDATFTLQPSATPKATATPEATDIREMGATSVPTRGPSSSGGFIWPTQGRISSYFGPSHPLGIDIDLYNDPNADIVAARGGTVAFAGGDSCCSYGYYVIIDHGNGLQTLYAHLSRILVSEGQTVEQGELVGYGGRSGYATGNHLHFEIQVDGNVVDPLRYLP